MPLSIVVARSLRTMHTLLMKTTQLANDARNMGLKVEVSDRVRVEGRLGDVIKAFAAQGCDVVRQSEHSYAVTFGGEHVAIIGHTTPDMKNVPANYAYGYTASA